MKRQITCYIPDEGDQDFLFWFVHQRITHIWFEGKDKFIIDMEGD